uniref:BZIP domain-containing protein n=1 Tax=Peronospora matthiolae TaxID=2874970 RepID=A0AAV1VIR7_9STRA
MDRAICGFSCPETSVIAEEDGRRDSAKRSKRSCNKRQQRYRAKQRLYVERLEITVQRLRLDVDQQVMNRRDVWEARFRDLQPNMSVRRNTTSGSDVVTSMCECMKAFGCSVQGDRARHFEALMRSDVHNGDLIGRDSILAQWKRLVRHFSDVVPVLEDCSVNVNFVDHSTAIGHVTASLELRLTRRNLAAIFPYTVTDMSVRDRLLVSPLVLMPMAVFFQFDEQGKVSRYDHSVDFVAGLYEVLRDYRDVASMLKSANLDASGQIRDDEPAVAISQLVCRDRRIRDKAVLGCPSKLSVRYLLSNGDTGE